MSTDTTPETASRLNAAPEDERPIGDEDTAIVPDAAHQRAMEEAGVRAWAQMQHDVRPFLRGLTQPRWLLLVVPVAVIYLYATAWLCRTEWFQFGSPLLIQPFVPLLALGLLWFRRQQIIRRFYELAFLFPEDSPKRRGNTGLTLAMVGACCLLILGGAFMQAGPLVLLPLIIATGAMVYGMFGPFVFRTLWQPLAFLLLVIPPPLNFLERVIFFLRAGTAYLTVLVAHQFDAGARQLLNASLEPLVHLSSGDLVISTALCGAAVVAAVAVLTVWWCVAKQIAALQSILLMVIGVIVAVLLNAVRLIIFCVLVGMGALSVSAPNPWLVDLTSAVLVALAFGIVVLASRRILEMMTRKAETPEAVDDDDMESDLQSILRGGEREAAPPAERDVQKREINR